MYVGLYCAHCNTNNARWQGCNAGDSYQTFCYVEYASPEPCVQTLNLGPQSSRLVPYQLSHLANNFFVMKKSTSELFMIYEEKIPGVIYTHSLSGTC
jgi:hypothetical protein